MRFKRSVNITADCFSEVAKLFLYRLVTAVISFSLIYLILSLGLSFIMKSAEFAALKGLLKEFLRAIVQSLVQEDASLISQFNADFNEAVVDFVNLLGANIGSIIGSLIGVCFIYILRRYADGLAQFAVGSTVNDRMRYYSHTIFYVSFFKNLGRAALYELLYVPLSFVYDVLSLAACAFLFLYLPSLFTAWGLLTFIISLALVIGAVICLQAVKLSFISSWMPMITEGGMSVIGAFKKTLSSMKGYGRRFASFLIACYLIVFVNVGFALFTAGSGLLLSVPLSYIFLIVLQYVNYYEQEGKQYFIEKNVVANADDDKPEQAE